jgi:DNA-binding CsgD family transcriptional regulator
MPVPASDQVDNLEAYAVIQLFVDRASRVSREFSLAAEKTDVVHICQLVEGIPLAVELAASWTPVLRCQGIAAEIRRSLQFLRTDLRDVPDRHRSMQAVFDQSWTLLDEKVRSVFGRLSVFRGGFQQEAAEAVAGASLLLLAKLVRKSLLHAEPDGRYQIHELLRQYAAERLAQAVPEDVTRTYDLHSVYYTGFLRARNAQMNGGRQWQATAEVAAELDNIRSAWRWAITRQNIEATIAGANPLYLFCQFRSRYREGIELFEAAVQSLDDEQLAAHPGATILINDLGWLCVRLGQLPRAQALCERYAALVRRLGEPPVDAHSSHPGLGLGLLASLRGDYAMAQRQVEQAYKDGVDQGHLGNQQVASYFLAGILLAQGQNEEAQRCAQRAYTIAQTTQNRWFMAYDLHEMGNAACALGEYAKAKEHYQAGYALREEFGDPEGMAVALNHLGDVALLQENPDEAEVLYLRSLEIYREINDQGGVVTALEGLARTYCGRGQAQPAAHFLVLALDMATTAQFTVFRLALLVTIGQLLLQTGRQETGVVLLKFAQRHPATHYAARDRAQRLLKQASSRLSLHSIPSPSVDDLDMLTARLRAELAELDRPSVTAFLTPPSSYTGAQPLTEPIPEPLTPRELELLYLLADGLSYQEIADRLSIAVGTVKSHAHHIYAKIGVRNRVQALSRARELGLLSR